VRGKFCKNKKRKSVKSEGENEGAAKA